MVNSIRASPLSLEMLYLHRICDISIEIAATYMRHVHSGVETMKTLDILEVLDQKTSAMTIGECAELLKVSRQSLYNHAQTGTFPTFQVAGTIRVNPAALREYLLGTTPASWHPERKDISNSWDRRRRK